MARKTAQTKEAEALASLSFGEAKDRLQTILESLEGHEVDIDDLADQVKEAAALIRVLNDKLTRTEIEVKKVVGELRPAADSASSGPADPDEEEDLPGEDSSSEEAPF